MRASVVFGLVAALVAHAPAPASAETFTVTPTLAEPGELLRFQVDSAGTFGEGYVEGAELPLAIRINAAQPPSSCIASRSFFFGTQHYGIDMDIMGPSVAQGWFMNCPGLTQGLKSGDYIVSLDYQRANGDGTASLQVIDIPVTVIGDRDGDGIADHEDNCPDAANPLQQDADNDGTGDACDPDATDRDNDGIPNDDDNCPDHANSSQLDTDEDGLGDSCDPNPNDRDNDDVDDDVDNCPTVFNPFQDDTDGNGVGDACESDIDGDGVPNTSDNCPAHPNPDQLDSDLVPDGFGDACDPPDSDGDGVANEADNCPQVENSDQSDANGDGEGDACDDDDSDGDSVPDASDNCPNRANPGQVDTDNDGVGDVCETEDTDGDGVANFEDNCPFDFNPGQFDADSDGQGDVCDPDADSDSDGIPDSTDNCDFAANPLQADANFNGIGDACDLLSDTDGDGLTDYQETVLGTSPSGATSLSAGINTYEGGEPTGASNPITSGDEVGVAILVPANVDSVAVTVEDPNGETAFEDTLVPASPVVFSFTADVSGAWHILAQPHEGAVPVGAYEKTLLVDLQVCGDPTADGNTTAADALHALRTAVGSATCPPCVCDVDGSEDVTASDALLLLHVAVGLDAEPACGACP